MMFTARLLLQVIFPGIAGFMLSRLILIPQVMALSPYLPSPEVLAIAATGFLTFAMAAVLRGWSLPVLQRLRPARSVD